MWRIGHRGASGYAPENTLISFEKALALGVEGIELDVRVSLDQQAMVIHDATLDRTTTASGCVKDYNSADLQQMGIPTLEAVFNLVAHRCLLNIEIKEKAALQPVLHLLEQRRKAHTFANTKCILSAFDWHILETLRDLHPPYRLGVLTEDTLEVAIQFAQKIGAFSLHPDHKLLTFEAVKSIQQHGIKVIPWTVNDPERIKTLKAWQVDGIISDFPDRL